MSPSSITRMLLCLLAATGCYDHNGPHCPGYQRICAWHFDSPDACGEYRWVPAEAGGPGSTARVEPRAFTDEDGACVFFWGSLPHPEWGPPEPWCNQALFDEPGPCEGEGEWLRSDTDEG